MLAIQVSAPGGPFEFVDRPIPQPGPGQVRVKVLACGVCHSDAFVKHGGFPGIAYPRVPGHEVAGVVDALGPDVANFQPGDRVGVGWHGGHCFACDHCRDGDFVMCRAHYITGITLDGGYSEYMLARAESLAHMPAELDPAEAAPLLCAGITTYNSLRNAGARGGDLVAVQGIGGLGHLGIQWARQLGFHTVAISRGSDKADLARKLGAHAYLDAANQDVVAELQRLGGARVILATAPNADVIASVIGGLGVGGKLIVLAAPAEAMQISPVPLIMQRSSIQGWPSGHARDSEATLRFAAQTGARAMIEKFKFREAEAAFEHMMSNKARFRVVLVP